MRGDKYHGGVQTDHWHRFSDPELAEAAGFAKRVGSTMLLELPTNNQGGFLGSCLPLSAPVAGTVQAITGLFASAPNFPTLTGTQFIKLVIDRGTNGYEIVYLIAYTSGSLDGTIIRSAEDSVNWAPYAHSSSSGQGGSVATWNCSPTAANFAGVPIVRHFPFAYNSTGISSGGFAFGYTPDEGDVLLDGWMEIDTSFDGTTPLFDIGWSTITQGLWGSLVGPLDTSIAGIPIDSNVLLGVGPSLYGAAAMGNAVNGLETTGASAPYDLAYAVTSPTSADGFSRLIPVKFYASNPMVLWVTQSGHRTGTDPVNSQGSGILYLVTATPA